MAPVSLVLAAMLLLTTGCLYTDANIRVTEDDRVSGRVIVGQQPEEENDQGPQLRVPDSLLGRARVQRWADEGYVGSELLFNDLSFTDFRQLTQFATDAPGSFDLRFSRAGDIVSLSGRADLRNVPDGSTVTLAVSFPSAITSTNGELTTNRSVTWTPSPGDLTSIRAETSFTDPNTRSFAGWTGLMIAMSVAAAVIVGALAWFNRDRSPKPRDLVH
ncbi:DUF3153 domain-containing protein [Hoyosella sp. YIM 151337]|uniref:LppM family (lipo)protein n=1 Tax=Hoyosella sp. YIM 151337 TaxID=2992742 RepID=UPI0022364BF3|nr:DUF3153 domain-containing protein [Hoyosella sp. YIM 151337]MCW4355411.1 DUF3153 domain-containing protein [Hoyosella sp. YIM 151337]